MIGVGVGVTEAGGVKVLPGVIVGFFTAEVCMSRGNQIRKLLNTDIVNYLIAEVRFFECRVLIHTTFWKLRIKLKFAAAHFTGCIFFSFFFAK